MGDKTGIEWTDATWKAVMLGLPLKWQKPRRVFVNSMSDLFHEDVPDESGPGARPMDLDWVRDIIAQCRDAGVACFVKQLGAVWARENGADPKGGDMSRWPADLRVRQFPEASR